MQNLEFQLEGVSAMSELQYQLLCVVFRTEFTETGETGADPVVRTHSQRNSALAVAQCLGSVVWFLF